MYDVLIYAEIRTESQIEFQINVSIALYLSFGTE